MKGKLTVLPAGVKSPPDRTPGEPAIDPVCGMTVDPRAAAGSHVHGGRTYWFCSTGCLDRFRADPERYLAQGARFEAHESSPAAAGPSGGFTCPMHPEVREPGPESCPMCGMALEPVTVEAPPTRTEWVCPMHPEVVRPGRAPARSAAWRSSRAIVALEEEVNPELRRHDAPLLGRRSA